MLLRFSCATFLGLASIVGTDAFIAPNPSFRTKYASTAVGVSGMSDNDDFLNALSGPSSGDDVADEEVGSESERFKALRAAAAQAQQQQAARPVTIDNPFLAPPTPDVPPANPADLSVEEQARLFREMMQGGGGAAAANSYPTPDVQRVAKTDRAGRPQGRNRDADAIANSSDVYFAQLKRDSTVRTLARLSGDEETASAVFEDDGIEVLSNLLQKNPYLKAQREEEANLIDQVPESMIAPYMDDKKDDKETLASTGVKWKDMMKNKRKGKGGQSASPSEEATSTQPEKMVAQTEPQPVAVPEPLAPTQPEPAVAATTHPEPALPQQIAQQQTAAAAVAAPAPIEQQQTSQVAANAPPATPEEARQKIRTLMGMLLKHRGGPGFGKGRLKGPDIPRFESLFDEVTAMLRNEALSSAPVEADLTPVPAAPEQVPATPQTIPEAPQTVPAPVAVSPAQASTPAQSTPTSTGGSDLSQVDGIVACIEGANTMFKNSPPELKPSVLISLRAALMAAVGTCNNILGNEITLPSSTASADMSQIDSSVACIEGAIAMYKNSPPELKESVLVTLRAALVSAVNTCDSVSGNAVPQQQAAAPAAEPAPVVPETAIAPKVHATDPNSKKLEGIYNSLEAAAGDGPLGLRSDLTSEEAKELENQIVEMRGILMNEMDAGIPDSDTADPKESASGSKTVSNYKEMLAQAKAEKVGI